MRALAAAALLALAWPAAALPPPGGGTAPASVHGYRGQLTIVSLQPAPARRSCGRSCRRAAGRGRSSARPLAADGTFAIDTTERDRAPEYPGVRRIADVKITGRIVGPLASGTARARVRLERAATRSAAAGRARAPGRRAPRPPSRRGPAGASRGYFGLTSSRRGRTRSCCASTPVARACRPPCSTTGWSAAAAGSRRATSRPAGGSRPAGRSACASASLAYANGTERFRVKVDGRFTPAGVNGTLSVARGSVRRCPTGRVTFAGAL